MYLAFFNVGFVSNLIVLHCIWGINPNDTEDGNTRGKDDHETALYLVVIKGLYVPYFQNETFCYIEFISHLSAT